MANETIHDQVEATSAATADEIALWVAASSVLKRITKANFMGGSMTGGGVVVTGGYTLTVPSTGTAMVQGGNVSTPIVAALDANGVQIRDDGGNVGVTVVDGGQVAVNKTTALAYTDLDVEGAIRGAGVIFVDRLGGNLTNYFNLIARASDGAGVFANVHGNGQGEITTTGLSGLAIGTYDNKPFAIGTNNTQAMTISTAQNAYFSADVSALSFTDRTRGYEGDALSELAGVKAKGGEVDHATLPAFARAEIRRTRVEKVDGQDVIRETVEPGRDLGAMISLLTVAVQQLAERVEALESRKGA